MAKSACKCKKPAECEECPEWIFTFADLVMLMMGFFVILWVLKPSPTKTPPDPARRPPSPRPTRSGWTRSEKIREGFGYVPNPESQDPVDMRAVAKRGGQESPDKGPGKAGATREPPQGADGTDALVMNVRPGTHVSVGGKLLFDPGDAKLTPADRAARWTRSPGSSRATATSSRSRGTPRWTTCRNGRVARTLAARPAADGPVDPPGAGGGGLPDRPGALARRGAGAGVLDLRAGGTEGLHGRRPRC